MKRIFHLSPVAAALFMSLGGAALADDAPVAATAHLSDDGERARLAFDLSAQLAGRARELVDPDRIVLDMPEVDFRLPATVGRVVAPKTDALVKAFRFGLFGPGKSRVIIDLARPACVAKVDSRRLLRDKDAWRLTLELKACSAQAFAAAAQDHAPPPVAETPAPQPPEPKPGAPVVVLDPVK